MNRTIENLAKAFVGESQARNRYTMYSRIAVNEGLEQIAEVYLKTAENEWEHAKWIFRMVNQLKAGDPTLDELKVEAEVPTILGTTAENLRSSIAGELHENTVMYPEFADMAEKEGFPDIAARLRAIGKAENHHKVRFESLLKELEGGSLFKKDAPVQWECRKCGYQHTGPEPPGKCPSCDHPPKYFQRTCESY